MPPTGWSVSQRRANVIHTSHRHRSVTVGMTRIAVHRALNPSFAQFHVPFHRLATQKPPPPPKARSSTPRMMLILILIPR